MKDLSDLLDKSFGGSNTIERKKEKAKAEYRTQRGVYLSRKECGDLVYALNYAINSIKNKKDVIEKKITSTRYEHHQRWTEIRRKIKEKLDRSS